MGITISGTSDEECRMSRRLLAAICVWAVGAVRLADETQDPGSSEFSQSPGAGGLNAGQPGQGLGDAKAAGGMGAGGATPSTDPSASKDSADKSKSPSLINNDPTVNLFWKTIQMESDVERILSKIQDDDQMAEAEKASGQGQAASKDAPSSK
eukprot:TRINITY_DN5139_c0_g1_i3.p1 TRINITY_DN5139_c0_g1~~TRINITY_DN5139_c0_g1_i3.p1  ORF type:complete len:153 (+),score=35.38 TRINITY_DN5139_c0_g1_i3:107-565(+)